MSYNNRVTTLDDLDKYQDIIFNHALTAATTGGTVGAFLPGLDTLGVSATWISMVIQISEESGNEVDEAAVQKFIIAVLQGAGSYIVGTVVLRYLLMSTGIGILGGAVLNALLNFLYTARLGIFMAEQYDDPGFSMNHAMSVIHSAKEIIFAVPTVDELRFAFKVTKQYN